MCRLTDTPPATKERIDTMCKLSPSMSSPLHPSHVPYRRAAAALLATLRQNRFPHGPPVVGIVCGSGLSSLSEALDPQSMRVSIPYKDIPGFPSHCTVAGHEGELVVGLLHGVCTICFRGRFHSYEGHSMDTVVLPVRVMRCLGVQLVIVTNAAGGLREEFQVGDVAVIRDHIALPLLCGKNPLVGHNDAELGPRFPPTSNLYDQRLQTIVVEVAQDLGFSDFLHTNGTYAFVSGPNYESKSECNMLRLLGADAVGMSTVPEILAAHHAGMAVLCLSLITNKVVFYDEDDNVEQQRHANHEEVLQAVKNRGAQMVLLVGEVVKKCKEAYLPTIPWLEPVSLETEGRVVIIENNHDYDRNKNDTVYIQSLCPFSIAKSIMTMHGNFNSTFMGGIAATMVFTAGVLFGMTMHNRHAS